MVGLNFANEQEAERFGNAVETKINERMEKKRANSEYLISTPFGTLCHFYPFSVLVSALKHGGGGGGGVGHPDVAMIGRPPVTPINDKNDPFAASAKKGKPKRPKGGKKFTKADIGLPSDFR